MKYFRYAYKTTSLLGLVPLYNFEKDEMCHKKQRNSMPLFIILNLILVLGLVFLLIPRLMVGSIELMVILNVLDFSFFVQMPVFCTIFVHIYTIKWEQYLCKFTKLYKTLGNYEKTYNSKVSLLIVIIFHIVQLTYIAVDVIHGNFNEVSVVYAIWYSLTTSGEIQWLYMGITCNVTLNLFKMLYKHLRLKLREIVEEAVDNKFLCQEEEVIAQIKKAKKWNIEIFDIISDFNILFGWFMMCNMLFPIINAIALMEYLLNDPNKFNYMEFTSVMVRNYLFINGSIKNMNNK